MQTRRVPGNRLAGPCILLLLAFVLESAAQDCGTLNLLHQADIPSTCPFEVMTMAHDAAGRPYLYVANKEAGLVVYEISAVNAPVPIASLPTQLFDSLHVANLTQSGDYLYLALGNSFTNPQAGGMAVVNVANPDAPSVEDVYFVPGSASGGGIVRIEGDYAYLGAMKSGLVILDVSEKTDVQFVSQFIPDIAYPPVPSPNPNFYNARGMEVRDGVVFLCYDAGGVRVIDCTDPSTPRETGRWCNPAMYIPFDHPKAYNNIVLDDTLAYVSVDYCGMEILSIADTANIRLVGWWNPRNCPGASWIGDFNTNELQLEKACGRIFISSGKSQMYVVDVSDPANPDSCGNFGGVSSFTGTWGVGVYQNQIYLSYVCALVPFVSIWTGLKILTFDPCAPTAAGETPGLPAEYALGNNFPNPFNPSTTIRYMLPSRSHVSLRIIDALGRDVATLVEQVEEAGAHSAVWEPADAPSGVYFYRLRAGDFSETKKLVLLR